MFKNTRDFRVLFGFNFEAAERAIFTNIESFGLKVQGTSRYTKTMIRDYIKKNPDLDAVFLKEYLDGGEKWGALEISELADECDANFVVIMRSANRGREAMKILYCAGVTGAVFADGKRGADPRLLAQLAVKGRHRKDAREYYKVDAPMPDYGVLNFEDFRDTYSYLIGDDIPGSTVIDRFVDITRFLSPKQLSLFIKQLPDDDLGDLQSFEEFYEITDRLRQQGYIFTKYKKPKNLMRAVDKDSAALVRDVVASPEYEKRPVIESVPTSSAPSPDDAYDNYGSSFERGYAISEDDAIRHGSDHIPSEEEAEVRKVKSSKGRSNPRRKNSAYKGSKADSVIEEHKQIEEALDEDSSYSNKDRIAYQTDDLLDINKVMYGSDAQASYETDEAYEDEAYEDENGDETIEDNENDKGNESSVASEEFLSDLSIDDLIDKYQ